MDDSLFISQEKSLEKSNTILFCSYNIITSLFGQVRLIVEHRKLEIFYFSKSTKHFYLSPLDLTSLGSLILQLKDTWKYLSFIFNRKLFFHWYIYYSCKALFMIKENAKQLYEGSITMSQMTPIQNLCSSYCSLWISSVVLQKCSIIPFYQETWKSIIKSYLMNHRSFPHCFLLGNWSHY